MKIWKKIFLYNLVLFSIVFNVTGIFIIENIYSRSLDNEIKSTINIEKNMINSIYLNSDLIHNYGGKDIFGILKSYNNETHDLKNIEIIDMSGNILFRLSDFNLGYKREELEGLVLNEYKYVVRTINKIKYISVAGCVKIGDKIYKIVLTKDITFINSDKKNNYKLFFILSGIVTLILALGLYIISKMITTPIEKLTNVSNCIKKGEYNKRVNYTSKDEIGILSQNFDSMMSVIEENIIILEEASTEKQRFIDNLSHEMKTPITSIIGYSDLLLKSDITEDIKFKALSYINSQGHRLENLNSSLIKLIMTRKKELELQKVNIIDLVNISIEHLSYKLQDKDITVIKDMSRENIWVDAELVEILLNNVLDNAIKASSIGNVICVFGEININDNEYKLLIKDNGQGISEDDLKKIKEPFYTVNKSRTNNENNMGLGLAICTDICNLNKIKFEIDSKLDKGTTIKLLFKMGINKNED